MEDQKQIICRRGGLKRSVTLLLVGLLGAFFSPGAQAQAKKKERPNLLVIMPDQWWGGAVGYEGKELVKTPHLDALAAKSLVLSQAIANYPLCSPSRAMFFSGTYPVKNKVYSNVNSKGTPFNIELPKEMVCWSDVLKENGYSNGYIGKWHLDAPYQPYVETSNNKEIAWNEWTAPDKRHGFDYWYAYGTYDQHDHPMYWNTHAGRNDFHYVKQWGPIHEADKAIEFFENKGKAHRKSNAPFSLVVSMNPPHSVYNTVPQKYYDLYKDIPVEKFLSSPNIPAADTPMGDYYRKNIKYYYANITGVDEQVGRILKGLKDNGLEDNTIVLFMADHGNCLGKHDEVSKNNFYEESLRIPFLLYWKGQIMPRTDHDLLLNTPDLYPTLLGLLGLENKVPATIDGKSYAAYIKNGRGEKSTEQYLIGSVKASTMNSGFRGIRTPTYKLVYEYQGKELKPFLFDLKKDPFESTNLYTAKPEVVATLLPKLKSWLAKNSDPFKL